LQRQFESLSSRSAQAKSDVAQFEQRMSAQGLRLRADVQDARSRVDGLLRASSDAIQSGDAAKAEENMRYADNAVRTMEKFLGR
jgi:ribosomal protein S20